MGKADQPQLPTTNPSDTMDTSKDLRVVAALVRTAFASEQTLMSWMRTSVSLFAFGIAIFQFFHFIDQHQGGGQLATGPRWLAIALICVGALALVLAMVEHACRLRILQQHGLLNIKRYLLPLGSAMLLLAIGLGALVSVILKFPL